MPRCRTEAPTAGHCRHRWWPAGWPGEHRIKPPSSEPAAVEPTFVRSSVGLDTAGSSVPYIAGWGKHGQLDAIKHYAETIDTIARGIEEVL